MKQPESHGSISHEAIHMSIYVYLETVKKRTLAGALDRPGWGRGSRPWAASLLGLTLALTGLIFASLACKLSNPKTIITLITIPSPTLAHIGEKSKPWSSAPTPLPDFTLPPPVEDQTIIDQAEGLYQQGREAYNAKDLQAAIEALNAAIELNPRHASAYLYRGKAYLSQGSQNNLSTYLENNDLAVMDFTRSIALDPNQWQPYYARGYSYHGRAQVEPLRENRKLWQDLAMNDLDRALELDEWQGRARAERVSLYLNTGECDKALDELLTPYWSNYPLEDMILLMIKTDLCLDDYAEATRLVNEQLAKGSDANLYWQRGLIYAGQEEYDKALAELDTATQLWSGDFVPGTLWYNRAAIEYYRGNYDLVKEYIQNGQRYTWIDWGSPYYFLGKVYLSEGKTDQAIEAFLWAEQTLEEGNFLNATRDQLSQLGALPPGIPTQTSTPKNVATLTPISGNTPIPTEMTGQIWQAYGAMVFIQINATFLNEIATRIQAGVFDDLQKTSAIQFLESFIQQADSMISQSAVPEALESDWEKALAIHAKTKDYLQQWKNQDIEPQQVTAEMKPLMSELDTIIKDVQKVMSVKYGFDIDELIQQQQDSLANVERIFGPATTPTPGK
jgi:tetratricopeptide (TPR) repeat protein